MIVCASTSFKFRRNPRSTSRCRKSANIDSQFCRRARAGSRHEGTFFHRRRSTRKRTRGTRATVKSRKGNAGGPRGSPRPINPPLRISSQPSDQERNCSYQPASLSLLSLSLPCLLPSSCRHQTKLLFHSSQPKSACVCSTGDTALNKTMAG